jgi:ubiquitin fusion degradation protein 1
MFGNFGGFPMGDMRPYNTAYRCFPVAMLPGNSERSDVENGGKIILPPSALSHLTRLNVVYPMLFKLTNHSAERITHCGVLEFIADEGKCYIPYWMMLNLGLREGGIVSVETAVLPVASFSKFEPQSAEFLDITNPKAMLENALRSFACLTTGDIIAIKYNDKLYELKVLETKPGNAVSIIECDMDVEFARPVDYVEPETMKEVEEKKEDKPPVVAFSGVSAFVGTGYRLDGKTANTEGVSPTANGKRGIPDYDWYEKHGRKQGYAHLEFPRNYKRPDPKKASDPKPELVPFSGAGNVLKPKDPNE